VNAEQVLRAAADHIETVGLNQDGHYYRSGVEAPDSQRPCCVVGAIRVVTPRVSLFVGESASRDALAAVARDLGYGERYAHDRIVAWNDDPQITQEVVLRRMRATADRLKAEEAAA